jgi:putative transposase
MTVRDIEGHLRDLYGVQVGRDTISSVTDALLEDVQAWRTRPLDGAYPIVYGMSRRISRPDHILRRAPRAPI